MRCDEEQDFRRSLRHQFTFEKVANDRNAGHPGSALSLSCILIGEDAAHDGRAAIRDQHFRLHALGVNAGNSTDGDTSVDGVILNRDAQHHRTCIGDLRSD